MKKNNKVLPSTRILSRYVFVAAITVVFIVTVIPIVLNYPPDSLNNAFDIQMSGIPFFAQVAAIFVGVGFFLIAAIKILFRQIDDWYKNPDTPKNKSLIAGDLDITVTNIGLDYLKTKYDLVKKDNKTLLRQ